MYVCIYIYTYNKAASPPAAAAQQGAGWLQEQAQAQQLRAQLKEQVYSLTQLVT